MRFPGPAATAPSKCLGTVVALVAAESMDYSLKIDGKSMKIMDNSWIIMDNYGKSWIIHG